MRKLLIMAFAALGLVRGDFAIGKAADAPPENPIVTQLIQCRSITADAERLACYDRQVAALSQAVQSSEVVVVDREQVDRTRRRLFGFSLPNLDFLGRRRAGSHEAEELQEITATIASARQDGYGRWQIRLEDGAKWRQIDDTVLGRDLHSGMQVTIRRAMLGAYRVSIAGGPGFKALRVNE